MKLNYFLKNLASFCELFHGKFFSHGKIASRHNPLRSNTQSNLFPYFGHILNLIFQFNLKFQCLR